ncbi:hypothetical protein PRIPAC_85231, partial [Pristionchus pacificus]|uniref:Uncharacterized protein n=1 Tax=Pristionchus pacificus TaxID=54126 RepID=A0A2A6BT25_PRIPA
VIMSRILIALLIASLAIAVASDGGVIPGLLGVVNQVVGLATNLLAAALPIPQGISNCAMQMMQQILNAYLAFFNAVITQLPTLSASAIPAFIGETLKNLQHFQELSMVNIFASTLTGFVGVFMSTVNFLFGTIGIILG